MNVYIVAVFVNILTLVNTQNVDMETLQKIMKNRPRSSAYSKNVEISDPDEVIPILPGFYLEKPKDISKSLFKNPKAWPDDIYAILNKEEAELNKTKVNVNTKVKTSKDEYLQRKILKAVQDLKRYRASQKQKSGDKFKARHFYSKSAQKKPDKKLLGRIFQAMNSGIDYKTKQKKPKKNTGHMNNKIIGELLKKILSKNLNNHLYQKSVQHSYAKPQEGSQNKEELLGNILNSIPNASERESGAYLRPSMVIILPKSLDNDDYEVENNAKEETSDEDNGRSDLLNVRTRRADEYDIGSKTESATYSSSSESGSSDYEKNPGNPFTVHKNKYKQNWPYNHFMDGDHMNINPLGPQFGSLGPSGPELFFGRKWWYFNQDDYKPMG